MALWNNCYISRFVHFFFRWRKCCEAQLRLCATMSSGIKVIILRPIDSTFFSALRKILILRGIYGITRFLKRFFKYILQLRDRRDHMTIIVAARERNSKNYSSKIRPFANFNSFPNLHEIRIKGKLWASMEPVRSSKWKKGNFSLDHLWRYIC